MATKVGEISITNFKKIKNLDIRANGGNVFIMGKNGTGKTTLIQALYCILTGKELPPDPITTGEHKGAIKVKLFNDMTKEIECIAELSFTEKNPKGRLTVTTEDGRDVPGGPRTFLDRLTDNLLFDPFEFIRKSPKEQVKEFKKMFGLNFDVLDNEHKDIWDKRAEVNKEIKNLKGVIETADIQEHELKLFTEKKDIAEIQAKVKAAEEMNNKIRAAKGKLEKAQNEITSYSAGLDAIREKKVVCENASKVINDRYNLLKEIGEQALLLGESDPDGMQLIEALNKVDKVNVNLTSRINQSTERIETGTKYIANVTADRDEAQAFLSNNKEVSVDEMNKAFQDAIMFNQKVDKVTQHRERLMILEEKEALSKQYSARLKEINEEKLRAVAEKGIPVPGLAVDFENECLTFEGLAFDETQISKSRIIAVGIEIMMATNPELRICRIKDGSLLDPDTLKELIDSINEQDYQAFIELVSAENEGLQVTVQEV